MSYATILDIEEMLESDGLERPKRRSRAPFAEPKGGTERSGHDDPATVGAHTKTNG